MSYFLLEYNPGTQQWGYPRRGASLSGTCIIHTAECAADNIGEDTSAEGCANMIANRADYGSYHCLCDSDSSIEMLPFEYEAWGDSETNPWAAHIAAALRTTDWATMPAERADRVYRNMAVCAAKFVQHMAAKGITVPLRRITGAEARARVPGFCAHGDSGIARSDPGANFDWPRFFRYTQDALNGTISPAGSITEEEDPLAAFSREELVQISAEGFDRWANGRIFPDGRNFKDFIKQMRTDIYASEQGVDPSLDIPALAKSIAEELSAKDIADLAAQLQITVKP